MAYTFIDCAGCLRCLVAAHIWVLIEEELAGNHIYYDD
jgi:hypothetical protein